MDFDFGDKPYSDNFGDMHHGPTGVAAFKRNKMSDLMNRPQPRWLIRNLIFQQQIGVVYAPPGSFKSFVMLDLCSRLTHGMEWQGRALKPCRVLYVAGEGYAMLYNRRLAWFMQNGMAPADDGLEVIEGALDLTSAETVTAFILEMRKDSDGIGLVVFDTLSTCTAGHNESDGAVMTTAIEHAKLIGRELQAAVMLIHHPGKDTTRGSRGHSSLLGNIDTEWLITRNGKDMAVTLTVTKQKDAEDGQVYSFTASKVGLGMFDDEGEERTSLCLTPAEKVASGCTVISQEDADRKSVVSMMDIGQILSVRSLAGKLQYLGGLTQVRQRIEKAIPMEWLRCTKGETMVMIRRSVHPTRNLHEIEMREFTPSD